MELYNVIIMFIVILVQLDNFILYNDFYKNYENRVKKLESKVGYIELNNINNIKLIEIINNINDIKNKKNIILKSSHSYNRFYNDDE